jgi:hypothetical protein
VEKLDLGYEVRRLLSIYREQEGVTIASAIRSLATELVHLCDEHDLDPDERFDAAIEVAIKYGDRSKRKVDISHMASCEHGRPLGHGCCPRCDDFDGD